MSRRSRRPGLGDMGRHGSHSGWSGRDTARRGLTLLEVVVAVTCSALIVQLALAALVTTRRVETDLRTRSERAWAARVARATLRGELRAGVAGRDWAVHQPDSVRLRSFRGRALVCPDSATTDLIVTYRGSRRPEPVKDSVLLLDVDGSWITADLVAVRSASVVCGAAPSRPAERWEIAPAPESAVVLARLFETASYHLADRALRYRVGSGGRQPLTAEMLDTRVGGFMLSGARVGVHLEAGGPRPWRWSAYLGGGP